MRHGRFSSDGIPHVTGSQFVDACSKATAVDIDVDDELDGEESSTLSPSVTPNSDILGSVHYSPLPTMPSTLVLDQPAFTALFSSQVGWGLLATFELANGRFTVYCDQQNSKMKTETWDRAVSPSPS
ncbi:hypothetical protein ONZ45_g1070 [Pleurotus djamor]|nr:hypothetical protein ONZ45_g1070 [Pleurotus djamor]